MPPSELLPQQALHTLYRDHSRWLQGWLSRQMGSRCDAADLMQDTFLRIVGRDSLDNLTSARGYLRTIAHGLMVNHLRRRRLERLYLEALACLPEPLVDSPDTRMMALETLYAIDRMLDGMPAKVRHAFLLSQLEGLGHAAIAERLKVSVSSVRKYLFTAIRHCLACQ
ncbi:MAG: sigma-70 family RNA polymerase sigma factor [Steroidobacter sp.]|nr:sigma-70 family RNA polymerase sigma factor [Steroidobacter sp.]MBL8267881.1 sigma-70 family RNA polymerase sigma factor [Steroidobacter sp.]